jgi:transcription elongation factor GreA
VDDAKTGPKEEPTFRRNPGDQPTAQLTQDAYDRLKKELDELRSDGRARTADRLQHARELGDIRENAEYDSAKNEQGLMEARIRELERLLKDPDIVAASAAADVAGPGTLVTLLSEEESGDKEIYLLAASKEERLEGVRTVSTDSPLGQALLSSRVGDRVEYEAPGGSYAYRVVEIQPRT